MSHERASKVNVRRAASIGSALVVAGIAALASYTHMRGLALRYGQAEAIADLLPISVDGMMVVATLALGDGRRYRWSAWLAFWIGVVASVVANVLAAQPSAIARCISAWPAVAFLLVVEVITRRGRAAVPDAVEVPKYPPVPDTEPDTVPVDEDVAALCNEILNQARRARLEVSRSLIWRPAPRMLPPLIEPVPQSALPAVIETTPAPVAVPDTEPIEPDTTPAPKRTPTRTPRRTPKADTTAAKIARLRTQRPDITQKQVADKVGVDVRTVRRYWKPDTPPDSEADSPPVNGTPVPELVPTGGES